MFDAIIKRKLSPEKEADTTQDDLKIHRTENVISQQISLYCDIFVVVSTCIVLLDSDSLTFSISNTILFVCCVIFNMSTLLIIHICLQSFVISYFLFIILLSFRQQKIVLMFLSYASVSSFSCDSISYFALDMPSALHIVYVPHPMVYILCYGVTQLSTYIPV